MKKGLKTTFIISTVIVIAALLALACALSAMADVPLLKDPEKSYSKLEGKGSYNEPYLIKTADDLMYLSSSVNKGLSYDGQYVAQAADIDLSGKDFVPIGINLFGKYFLGTYDGMGYTISNMNISGQHGSGENSNGHNAMFGFLGGRVQNVTIVDSTIEGSCAASIASHGGGKTSYIINCYSSATVDGTTRSGGIVDNYNGFVYACVFDGDASAFCSYTCREIIGCYSNEPLVINDNFRGITRDSVHFDTFGTAEAEGFANVINEFRKTNNYRPFNEWKSSDGAAHTEPLKPEKTFGETMAGLIIPLICVTTVALAAFIFFGIKSGAFGQTLSLLKRSARPIHLYLALASVISVLSVIFIAENKDTIYNYLIGYFGGDIYADFFNHIDYCKDLENVYYQAPFACFPPLAYVIFYYPLSRILPEDAVIRFAPWQNSSGAFIIYTASIIFCCLAIFWFTRYFLKKFGTGMITWVSLLIFFSNAFFFGAIERGNSVIIVLALLMAAMWLRERDSKAAREVALILIAIAAGFKAYPALFGLLYIVEKRWKETVRLLIYGILFFFVPFAFCGGWEGFLQFLRVLGQVQNDSYVSYTSITSSVAILAEKTKLAIFTWEHTALIATAVFTLINTAALFSKKLSVWERAMIICCIAVLAPAWSGTYTCIYFAVPMIIFFAHTQDGFGDRSARLYNILCAIAFAVIFSLISFVTPSGSILANARYIAIMVIDLLIIIKAVAGFVGSRKRRSDSAPTAVEA